MYIITLKGEVVAVTNTFASAVSYADGIRGVGGGVGIMSATPDEVPAALRALEQRAGPWGQPLICDRPHALRRF